MSRLWSALTNDLKSCYVTNMSPVHVHHIFPGKGRRKLCEQYGFIVPLHPKLHNLGNDSVHAKPNQGLDLMLKQECQRYFESHYGTRKDFINIFRRSYL